MVSFVDLSPTAVAVIEQLQDGSRLYCRLRSTAEPGRHSRWFMQHCESGCRWPVARRYGRELLAYGMIEVSSLHEGLISYRLTGRWPHRNWLAR